MARVVRLLVTTLCLAVLLVTIVRGTGDSPVAKAVKAGDLATVRKLIAAHADVNATSGDGSVPLLWAAYDSDIEMARKLVKKIGQELAADPEFASSTIQPLKMQGVDSFGDSGIVLRIKLMTKPGEQFGIKRKAFVMIKKAFDDNGIKLAVPTVQVAGSEEQKPAAAEAVRRRAKAKEAAAAVE